MINRPVANVIYAHIRLSDNEQEHFNKRGINMNSALDWSNLLLKIIYFTLLVQ